MKCKYCNNKLDWVDFISTIFRSEKICYYCDEAKKIVENEKAMKEVKNEENKINERKKYFW